MVREDYIQKRFAEQKQLMEISRKTVLMLTADRKIDRRILLESKSLENDGWDVTILAMPKEDTEIDDPQVVRIGTGKGIAKRENLVLNAYRLIRGLVPMNGPIMRRMKKIVWRYFVDQETFYARLFFDSAAKYCTDVIVAHDLPMLPLAKQLADKTGAKLVYDSHELFSEQEFSYWEKRRWGEIEAKYISACDAIITVNASIAAELERHYPVKNVNVIYNAEQTTSLPKASKVFHRAFNLTDEKRILLFQGGLSAGRNIENLVMAMQHVQDESVVLVVLGDGLILNKLKKNVEKCHLQGKVKFHPAVAQSDLLSFTVAADAGVIPYQSNCLNSYYCTPNKLFEYIAAGIPILATDLPEITKIVAGNTIGTVGDTSSSGKMAGLIDSFFSDMNRFTIWSENIKVLRGHINWEQESIKLKEIFGHLRIESP